MHKDMLRSLIKEMLESDDEELDEFSGVGALGGGPATPLGTDARYPDSKVKRKKVDEASTMSDTALAFAPMSDSGDISSEDSEDSTDTPDERKAKAYHRSLLSLSRAYGGSEPPLKTLSQAKKFLFDRS